MNSTKLSALPTLKLEKIEYFGKHYEVRLIQDPGTIIFIVRIENIATNETRDYECIVKTQKEISVFYENPTVDGLPDQASKDIQNSLF